MAALAACDVDDLRPPEVGGSPAPTAGATTAPDADTVLVESLVAMVVGAQETVRLARRRFTSLRPALKPLVLMHRRHLDVLLQTEQQVRSSVRVPRSAADALREVRTAERDLQNELADGAVQSHSGALARLLASMSASVAQHLAELPSTPAAEGPG